MAQDARRDEELTTQRRATMLGLDYIDTSSLDKNLYKDLLSKQELYDLRVIPLESDQSNIKFGVTNTTSKDAISNLRQRFLDQRVSFNLISDTGYREYMKLYDPPKKVEYHDISVSADAKGVIENVSQTLDQVKADDMLAYLIDQAYKLEASDIHTETQKEDVRIRFRIHGVLHPVAKLSKDKYRTLIGAIASAADISTADENAQQGHISQRKKMADGTNVDINIRLETTPTVHGMDTVMRLFHMTDDMFNLDRLGLAEPERKVLEDIISSPTGLVLTVGPTGSGKTTTLYSILKSLHDDERKIITIEDPVEYQFEGMTQIPVNSKTAEESRFDERLRATLRLDPDIIMVGEIRDMDTAKTALQASLTGHLVISTFHASSAAAALTRLKDITDENPLYFSAIRLIMAQRLVRQLDHKTKIERDPTQIELDRIRKVIDTLPEGVDRPDLAGLKLYDPGSSEENPYGYEGRLAIREQFTMTEAMMHIMTSKESGLSEQEIQQAAISNGMITMEQNGILKVIEGETTLGEIYRVVE